ncbi:MULTISPECIES: hypothetical protein [unclassified Bradyrhizobium]|uniref:hypothetical protein n=1 Tax=unclassified Bradyrhizobium TaxID=2631580 RepID=UPI0028E9DC86|nr:MULTISPECIES: hypothetical protein [unclassified Bradyrhizobium]
MAEILSCKNKNNNVHKRANIRRSARIVLAGLHRISLRALNIDASKSQIRLSFQADHPVQMLREKYFDFYFSEIVVV